MKTIEIKNNEDLKELVSKLDTNKRLFAIKTQSKIEVFENKKSFSKVAKTLPNAVQGELTPYNYDWYSF